MNYLNVISDIWQHHDLKHAMNDYTNLVRYATMAASSHNTQPWKFQLDPGRISIFPDFTRRCPIVDPDDHHLFVSLGCCLTNLEVAASAAGLHSHIKIDMASLCIMVDLEASPISRSPLFESIPTRQCSRTKYDGSEVSLHDLKLLEKAGSGNGVSIKIFTGESYLSEIAKYVIQGNHIQMNDPKWIDELKYWLRFNQQQALKTSDGLYGRSMGNPDAPKWVGNFFLRFALTAKSQNKKDITNILSSSGIAVIISDHENQANWIEAGRCYERFALQAEALDLRTAFINPPVEIRELRSQFSSWLGIGERRPNLVVRFGRGPRMPPSLRRPVTEVIIS